MPKRPAIPKSVQRDVLFEARHRCAVCCDPLPLQYAHIVPWCETHDHSADNLIALCSNCHSRADHEGWGESYLRRYKEQPCVIEKASQRRRLPEKKQSVSPEKKLLLDAVLALDPDDMTEVQRLRFLSMVAAYLDVNIDDIKIISITRTNSSKVRLELPADVADQLIAGFQSGDAQLEAFFEEMPLLRVERVEEIKVIAIEPQKIGSYVDIDAFIQQILGGEVPAVDAIQVEEVSLFAVRLKTEAEHYMRIDLRQSMQFSDAIVRVGEAKGDLSAKALGMMSRADVFAFMHQSEEAWRMFGEAGELFNQIGDEVGWARSRIGRLAVSVDMGSVDEALRDADEARRIFQIHQDYEKLLRLETNAVVVLNHQANYSAVIEKSQEIVRMIEDSGEVDANKLLVIYVNLGNAYQGLGNFREALKYFEQTRALLVERGEKLGVALVDLFIINVAQAQGHHKKALRLLHETIGELAQHQDILPSNEAWHLVEGYLFLNRFDDARDLAYKVVRNHAAHQEHHDLALALMLMQIAVAESALDNFEGAFENLERAQQLFEHLNAVGWLGTAYLYRGQAAFRQGDLVAARSAVRTAAERFRQDGQQTSYLMALLLATRIEIADGQTEAAYQGARDVQHMARRLQVPHLSYETHLLLGKIAEQSGQPRRAIRHYQIATATIERIQRSLVLTSRADFLADKQESVQALVRLNLAQGQMEAAFAALERAKAQVWLGYLSQLEHLRWLQDDPHTQPLIDELSQLREEHHWFYRIAYDPMFREQQHSAMSPAEAAAEASIRERRLRALTEQLYLHSGVENLAATSVIPTSDIQAHLNQDTILVAYYSDQNRMWGFVMDNHSLEVYELLESVTAVENLLDKWQSNINRALRTVPGSAEEGLLRDYSLTLANRLYDALVRPFAARLDGRKQVVIVPYGSLHYLPFQLLHDSEHYLIEKIEVVILPTASLITRPRPSQRRGALALAYSWDGRLHYTKDEAQRVVERFGGQVYAEEDAGQTNLDVQPSQILHITAHGQYRMDQPEFSYIQLADGPLYTDDLFQHDLSYELVTLSACETGRSQAAAGDELIGLGRGFLFGGAGALIASLWRVDETLTLELMDELYQQLDGGASKATALRAAQLKLKGAYPGLHPAFWGAFELIGNADPLTITG